MALSQQEVQQLMDAKAQLQARLSERTSGKISDLPTDTLLARHEQLKAERMAMDDTVDGQVRGGLTNKVKTIEKVLSDRGVEFEPLPQANQPVALADLDNVELLEEIRTINADYPTATAGIKSKYTTRLKKIEQELDSRLAAMDAEEQDGEQPEASEPEVTETPEPEPTDEELVAVASTETEVQPKATRRSRNR